MKYCPNCGTAVNDGSAFCSNCGMSVGGSPSSYSTPVMEDAPAAPGYSPSPYGGADSYGSAESYGSADPYGGSAPYGSPAPYGGSPYGAPSAGAAPVGQLKTNRGLLKLILLNFLTLGIYGLVVMSNISSDINLIAGRYDGRKTMHYCLVLFIFSWLTLGIYPVIWTHQLCSRIGNELRRRGIAYDFDASTFWLWGVLGSLIVVGPFIYTHKLLKAMNLLAANYNIRG